MQSLYPGVLRVQLGSPEQFTPTRTRFLEPAAEALAALAAPPACPLDAGAIWGEATGRGYELTIPLADDEELYGFGLQFHSFRQRKSGVVGLKKTIRVNSDPVADTGDSHAPVPFYVSTRGYGVLVDTSRYATFYCGSILAPFPPETEATTSGGRLPEELVDSIRNRRSNPDSTAVRVEIPCAPGASVYVFWGADLREAVQRYNLFSGGGCLPPRWGLGNWFRVRADFDQQQVAAMAGHLRERAMPCDVLGLEPGWQTHSYPCSFEWSDKFPDPQGLAAGLKETGYRLNLWTHLFVSPAAPIYPKLLEYGGDSTAFGGLVPDLTLAPAREILAEHHRETHVAKGVSGYKLDECDNSDYVGMAWSFPEVARFPGGMDGEQMHSRIGLLYQETIDRIFRDRGQRTYNSVRSSHALAAPYPFVLYSDLYDHREFVRALVNASFAGLLWSPEVRHAVNPEDLIRRLQTVVCSPQSLVNSWYIQSPPWEQWDPALNNAGERAEGWEAVEASCRKLLQLRMQLVPYLYAAFAAYRETGLPPFRALVQDYPQDLKVRAIDDQYMMGDVLLVAPLFAGRSERKVYLPEGRWHDFFSGAVHEGGAEITCAATLDAFPLFVKDGAVLALAEVTEHTGDAGARNLAVRVYGDGRLGCELFEDDGETYGFESGECSRLSLAWDAVGGKLEERRTGRAGAFLYNVVSCG